jgi:hypothetical protein
MNYTFSHDLHISVKLTIAATTSTPNPLYCIRHFLTVNRDVLVVLRADRDESIGDDAGLVSAFVRPVTAQACVAVVTGDGIVAELVDALPD